MSALISDEYRADLNAAHRDRANYGKRGSKWAFAVMRLCTQFDTCDVLDYGCGKSTLGLNLPFNIQEYDPGIPKHSADPRPADIVVCTDVLEHIEPTMVDAVVAHLKSMTNKVLLLNVSLIKAQKHFPDGRNYHLTIRPQGWWLAKFDDMKILLGPEPGYAEATSPGQDVKEGDLIGFTVALVPCKPS